MNILVIGGGAAGLMAAGTAAENGARVTLLETNEKVGRKLFITGKGRCNVCNNCDIQTVLQNVPVNPRFLYSALGGFSPEDAMAFFTSHGVPLKTEPVSYTHLDVYKRQALECSAQGGPADRNHHACVVAPCGRFMPHRA